MDFSLLDYIPQHASFAISCGQKKKEPAGDVDASYVGIGKKEGAEKRILKRNEKRHYPINNTRTEHARGKGK